MVQKSFTAVSYKPVISSRQKCRLPFLLCFGKSSSLAFCFKVLVLDVDFNADGMLFHILGPNSTFWTLIPRFGP